MDIDIVKLTQDKSHFVVSNINKIISMLYALQHSQFDEKDQKKIDSYLKELQNSENIVSNGIDTGLVIIHKDLFKKICNELKNYRKILEKHESRIRNDILLIDCLLSESMDNG